MATKPGLEVVLGGMGKSKDESKPMGGADDTMGGMEDASQALLEAVKTNDASGIHQALMAFCDMYMSKMDMGEPDEPKGV